MGSGREEGSIQPLNYPPSAHAPSALLGCLLPDLGEALLLWLLLGWWYVSAEQQVTSSVSSGSSNCGLGWLWLCFPSCVL